MWERGTRGGSVEEGGAVQRMRAGVRDDGTPRQLRGPQPEGPHQRGPIRGGEMESVFETAISAVRRCS